jgi:hypothetical protein
MPSKIILAVPIFLLLLVGLIMSAERQVNKQVEFDQGVKYDGTVCVSLKRAGSDEWQNLGCYHNILYNTGKDLIKTILGDTGTGGPVKNIALCNATAGCGEPVADATETWNPITTCGLAEATGTYASVGTGNWTITKTFSSTCDNVQTNVTRLRNSAGTNFAGRSFTLATLQNGDSLQITWYVWVT